MLDTILTITLEIYSLSHHKGIIWNWEKSGEHQNYLTHLWPRYIRNNQPTKSIETAFYMIKFENKYAGHCWLEEISSDDAKLGIFIAPDFRNMKIGQQTIQLLKKIAVKKYKLKNIYLNVRKSNTRAISCYQKCGFKIITEKQPKINAGGTIIESFRMLIDNLEAEFTEFKN